MTLLEIALLSTAGGGGGTALAASPCPEKEKGTAPLFTTEDPSTAELPITDKEAYESQAEGLACMGALIFYTWSRLLSTAAPQYSMRFGQDGAQHGLSWELAYELRSGGWRHGLYASVAYYPRVELVQGRAGYRYRLFTLDLPPRRWDLHGYVSAGGFWGGSNGGTRLAARLRLGWLEPAGGGLFVGLAWEAGLNPVVHQGELCAGIEFHW